MGIADEGKIDEVLQGLQSTLSGQLSRPCITAQHLGDFEVEEVGSVQRLTRCEQSRGEFLLHRAC